MKFTPNFAESYSQVGDKPLYSSASSKMFLGQSRFQSSQVQKRRVSLSRCELTRQVKNYEWRNKTEFPIVRVRTWQIVNSNNEMVQLEISYQSISMVLQQMGEVPLFKMMYLLKQTLIGYERIYNRFGGCKISSRMIGINQFYRCKVWINQDFASNLHQSAQFQEKQFILQICRLFEQKTISNKNSINFYGELIKCNHFSQFIYFVDHYAKDNKIVIPSFFKTQNINSFTANQRQQIHKFHPNLTMSRAPTFVNNMRDTLPSTFDRRQLIKEKAKEQTTQNFVDSPQKLCLKTSGQTRADIYGSSTIADSKCKESYFLQNHHFPNNTKRNPQDNMQKSQFLQFKHKGEKRPKLTHKVTNKQMYSCFTPQPRSYQFLSQADKWDQNRFLQPLNTIKQSKDEPKKQRADQLQQQDTLQSEFENLFEKNHWQQKIGGLFNEEQQQMKKSFNEGEQPKWKEQNNKELTLLKHFGKTVFQSSLHEERQGTF